MIPVPVSIKAILSGKLKLISSRIGELLLTSIFSVPVFREGNILHFKSFSLEITEACSGIKSMMGFIMFGCLLAHGLKSTWKKLFLMFSAIPISILVNAIRINLIGIGEYYFSIDLTKGFVHELFGLLIITIGISLLVSEYFLFADIK